MTRRDDERSDPAVPEFVSSANFFGGLRPLRMERVDDHVIAVPLTVTMTRDDAPAVELLFDVVAGAFQCREVTFTADDGGREVRGNDLRSVPLETVTKRVFELWARPNTVDLGEYEASLDVPLGGADGWRARRALDRSRAGVTHELLERVARVYRENPNAPTKAVTGAFGVSPRTAGNYVARARKAGLLPAPTGRRS